MQKRKFRPDLTEYRVFVEFLQDRLNQDAIYKMSLTDILKILIEQKMAEIMPDVEVRKKRKVYQRLEF